MHYTWTVHCIQIVEESGYRTLRYLDTPLGTQASGAYPHLTFIGVQECDRACALYSRYACAFTVHKYAAITGYDRNFNLHRNLL